MSRCLVLCLSVFLAATPAFASQNWTGVWRLVTLNSTGQPEGIFHLVISGENKDQIQVYESRGMPFLLQLAQLESEQMSLLLAEPSKPLPLSIKATRVGDQLKGEWRFIHFQYSSVTGGLVGTRAMALRKWDPFEALRRQRYGGIVDLNSYLLNKAPLKSLEEFQRFWDAQVEPTFYFLVEKWLYGDGKDPNYKKQQLARVLSLLRSSNSNMVTAFPSLVREAARQVRAKFPDSHFVFYVVSSPAPETLDTVKLWSRPLDPFDRSTRCCSTKAFLEEKYIVFNPFELQSTAEWTEVLIKKEIFLSTLWPGTPNAVAMEVFQEGLALLLALEGKKVQPPSASPQQLAEYRKELANDLSKEEGERKDFYFPSAADLTNAPGYVLGYDFSRSLLAEFKLEQLLNLTPPDAALLWQKYLKSSTVASP